MHQEGELVLANEDRRTAPGWTITAISAAQQLPPQCWLRHGGPARDLTSLYHLDRQLLAMIDDAGSRFGLAQAAERVLVHGFSASGQFANRLALLHPDRVLAVAAGGVGGFMVPLERLGDQPLPYPLGVADLETIAGHPLDLDRYRRIPQLFYVGTEDRNDPLAFDDGYDEPTGALGLAFFGSQGDGRFDVVERAFHRAGCRQVVFRRYEGMGHEMTDETRADVLAFFRGHLPDAAQLNVP